MIHITQNLFLTANSGTIQPLTHARIGYQNLLTSTNIGGTSGIAPHYLTNIVIDQTFETYKPDTIDPEIDIDLGSAQPVNYFGLVGRSMGAIKLQYSLDNISFVDVLEINDGTEVISMGLFDEVTAQYWKFIFTGENQEIIKVNLGKTLDMQRPIYGGHTPITLNRATVYKNNRSEKGQYIGRTKQRQGFSGAWSWQNLTAAWYRENFDLFVEAARDDMFFIAWRPESYSDEVGYCQTSSDISPQNQGVRDLMSVSMSATGFDVRSGQ